MFSLKPADTLSELEVTSIAHHMADSYWRALRAEAHDRVSGLRYAPKDKEQLLDTLPSSLECQDLAYAEQNEPGAAAEVYAKIKQVARDHLEKDERAAEVVAGEMTRPLIRARYIALRESFIADWKPTGSIEVRLIEMIAQLYTSYEHWMALSVQRVAFDWEQEHYNIRERGKWRVVSVAGDAEVNQAAEMADRFNRLFLRTLRQLRDLRRYNLPVMINNPQQVNIAAEGGQQVNVKAKGKRRKKASQRKVR